MQHHPPSHELDYVVRTLAPNADLPLVLSAAQYLRRNGPVHVEVESWGDETATLTTYQELGFRVKRQAIVYERAIEPQDGRG